MTYFGVFAAVCVTVLLVATVIFIVAAMRLALKDK